MHTYYIFEEGSSGDSTDLEKKKSTGLGLSNFDKRMTSIGASLQIVTLRGEKGQETYFTNVANDNQPKLSLNTKHGTIFELRLPIVDKKAA